MSFIQVGSNVRAKPLVPPRFFGWKDFVSFPNAAATISQAEIAQIRATYDSEIRATDSYIGQLLRRLQRDGRLDDTVVVFTSDHGESFFDHGKVGHGHLYADNLRVPLILRFPAKLPRGAVVEERVQLADVVPTCLDLLEINIPDTLEGISLVSRVTRKEPLPERTVVSVGKIAGISYVTPSGGKFIAPLLVNHAVGQPRYYELEADPKELDDLYPKLGAARVAQLRREVAGVLEKYHGLHFVFSPPSASRFEGTLSLAEPRKSVDFQLRMFPLEQGWVSVNEDGDAQVATGWFDRWWLHLKSASGRFTIAGRLIDRDGQVVEIHRSFSLDGESAGEPIPSADAADQGSLLRAYSVSLAGGTTIEAVPEPSVSRETRRQLEALGYTE